jgi:hypothetical protein
MEQREGPCPTFGLWPVRLYFIFPHYLINGTISKRVIDYTIRV